MKIKMLPEWGEEKTGKAGGVALTGRQDPVLLQQGCGLRQPAHPVTDKYKSASIVLLRR